MLSRCLFVSRLLWGRNKNTAAVTDTGSLVVLSKDIIYYMNNNGGIWVCTFFFFTVHELSELQPRLSCVRVELAMSPNLVFCKMYIFLSLTVNCHKSSPMLVLFSYGSLSLKFLSQHFGCERWEKLVAPCTVNVGARPRSWAWLQVACAFSQTAVQVKCFAWRMLDRSMSFKCQRDCYLQHFKSAVLSCEPSRLGEKEGYEVVLKDTILFPEGGGQVRTTMGLALGNTIKMTKGLQFT